MKRRRKAGFAISGTGLVVAMFLVLRREPVALVFKTWNAIPCTVTDSEGRTGQLYRAPHGTLELVIFNKGQKPRPDSFLDRIFIPKPETKSTFYQCTIDPKTFFVGRYYSDEVFQDFLLSRIDSNGWADSQDGLATVKPEGLPNIYLMSHIYNLDVPSDYTIKFQIRP